MNNIVGKTVLHRVKSDTAPMRDADCPRGVVVAMTTEGQLVVQLDDDRLGLWKVDECRVVHPDDALVRKTELLVLSGRGVRTGVLGDYGLFDEIPQLEAAIAAARVKLVNGHARAFVAIRIEADLIDGIGDGTERELARFEVYFDRVALVPGGQGGLSAEQAAKVLALPRKSRRLL